jgi:hypothetical protein
MTRHLHEPANALLYRALDLPPEERQQFIADACAGEPDLLELVRTLLARISELDEFLESPLEVPVAPVRLAIAAPHIGDAPAPFAVPQVPPSVNHPDIAPLFPAAAGEGVPIDQYCADFKLTLRQRAALFARVCHAMQYAHQHLVMHRNLKPSSILIGPDGIPSLLDFGIAGASGAPLFASPEQLAGQPLTTGSDIYSLGAILYGLLSGRSPNAAEATGIISTLAPSAPVPPSEAVTEAVARQYPPLPEFPADEQLRADRKLARQLQGDLDHILMKAIALDPAQRYASADAFAIDLERYVAQQPILAAPASAQSGLPWMLKRHPFGIAAAVLAASALVIGSGLALWHARQADQARAVAEQRLEQSREPARVTPSETAAAPVKAPASAQVLRAAGDLEGAEQAALLSLGLAEKQSNTNPRELSAAQLALGGILVEQGRAADGLSELRKALTLREQQAAAEPGNEQATRDVADAHWAIGAALMAAADYAGAEPELTAARDTYAAQLKATPADAALHAGVVALELARANVQRLQRHGRDAVQTLAALHGLASDTKSATDPQLAARIALLDAHIQPRGTPAQAFAAAERALGELLKHTEKDSIDIDQLRESALAWQATGEIGLRARQTESACRYLGLAAKRYEEFATSKRLNAIDKLRQAELQEQRKACG